jgi:hypothetical protein
MSDFFDKSLAQSIVAGLIVALISILLARRTKQTSSGKGWKVVVVLSYLSILGGLVLYAQNAPHGGFENPYTGMGASLFFLGLIMNGVGRFFVWWQR